MTTATVPLTSTTAYTLITSATDFAAQNIHSSKQEWVRAASLPVGTVQGVLVSSEHGMVGSDGTGNLYAKGKGSVVVIT